MTDGANKTWVGLLEDEGVVVFDPRTQLAQRSEWVVLWSEKEGYRRFVKEMVRKYLSKVELSVAANALANYRLVISEAAVSQHRQRLDTLGLPYEGVSTSDRAQRVAHCFSCQELLDSDIDLQCNKCNWILCRCGACGCSYTPRG